MAHDDHNETPKTPRRRRRWWTAVAALVLVLLLVLAAAGLIVFSGTDAALRLAIAEIQLRSGGALRVEGATGSLWSTIRAERIEWRGPDTTIVAETVALEWTPSALLSRRIFVRGLGAQSLRIAIAGQGGAALLPPDLLPPFDVRIERLGVARIDWSAGSRAGAITGLAFGYDADRAGHRIRDLAFITEYGAIRGNLLVAAVAPFALDGILDLAGDGPLIGANASIAWSGTVELPIANARGAARGASYSARAELTPFAELPLAALTLEAQEVDLAAFVDRLPRTRLALAATARVVEGRLDGRVEASNAEPGTLDAGRVPLAGIATRFGLDAKRLTFDDAVAAIPGGGRVTGRGEVMLADPWLVRSSLAVRDLDLARIHSTLIATRLAGSLGADIDGARRRVSADLTHGDLAINFAALIGDERADIERFRARAGGGYLEGRGRIAFDAARSFDLTARAQAFDPSRLGRAPRGSLSGDIALRGALAPHWQVNADITLDRGSKIADAAITGRGKANVTAQRVRDLKVDLTVAGATLQASGNAGEPGDALAFTLDAPQLSDLAPLIPATVPRPLAGSLRAQGTLRPDAAGVGITAEVVARAVQVGPAVRLGKLQGRLALAPGGSAKAPRPFEARELELEFDASDFAHPRLTLASARARASGTLGAHSIALAARGEGIDIDARAHGALSTAVPTFDPASLEWAGTLDALTQREVPAFRLLAPATLVLGRDRMRIGTTEIAIADGRAQIQSLDWVDGRATTRGAFTGIPLTSLARLAGRPFPLATDMVLGGEWSLAATPLTNGTIAVHREKGDVYFDDSATFTAGDLAFGTTRLDANARFTDDSVAAQVALRSSLGGNVDIALALAPTGSAGLDRTARLAGKLDAELPTLRALQPMLGTRAVVDGRVRVSAVGGGTLVDPVVTATLDGDGLRIDAPQYGISLRDGRIRARLARDMLTLDEFSLSGGDGRFVAQGVLARPDTAKAASSTRLSWRAENFRLMNRPDRRLTVEGAGTFTIADRKLGVGGELRVVSGHFAYERATGGTLGDDVVVVGRERPNSEPATARGNLPLVLDLDLDLGDGLTFTAEGLDTMFAGRVRITSDGGALAGRGTISAARGTYYAFGQRLTIDRGRLIFDGPLDNPALDIVALRRNLAVEAGVELTGTVRVPQVRLVSTPPVSDGEKLAWLVTGRGLDRASAADLSTLSLASAALLGSGGRPVTAQIAQRFGLDDIAVRSGGVARRTNGDAPLAGQVVSFGKRLSDNLTIAFEQGLTVASNALRIEYALTRTLTLRAEAGTVSNIGVFYRRAFE